MRSVAILLFISCVSAGASAHDSSLFLSYEVGKVLKKGGEPDYDSKSPPLPVIFSFFFLGRS